MIQGSHACSAARPLPPASYHYENTSNIRQIIYQFIDTDQYLLNKILDVTLNTNIGIIQKQEFLV